MPKENQINDQDDRADEQQGQRSRNDHADYPQRDRAMSGSKNSTIAGSPISRMSAARTC
jgi:hypothetical protein